MTRGERWSLFLRMHALQVAWNFKGMQHLGFLFALRPVLRRLWHGEAYAEAERRQVQFFNTHPYFAPICAGVVVKFEEELAAGTFAKAEMIPVLKNRMSGPLAAVGDAFFWETLRPVMASLAVLGVYAFGPASMTAVATIIILGCIYILPVTLVRWQGLDWGYRYGLGVVEILKRRDFHGSMRRIRNGGALLLGGAAVWFVAGPVTPQLDVRTFAARACILALVLWGSMRKISPTTLLYVVALLGVIVGALL